MQINDLEENIASIVRRNDIVDGEIQGIKSEMISLADKILAIKVSSIHGFSISMEYDIYCALFTFRIQHKCLGLYKNRALEMSTIV